VFVSPLHLHSPTLLTITGSTNVYEERSLGIYGPSIENEIEPNASPEESRTAVWGKYLGWHLRKQLAFGEQLHLKPFRLIQVFIDMWWLALALFLICIIEVTSDHLMK
jgi:hypothetical protein